jgi:hypothetical protein
MTCNSEERTPADAHLLSCNITLLWRDGLDTYTVSPKLIIAIRTGKQTAPCPISVFLTMPLSKIHQVTHYELWCYAGIGSGDGHNSAISHRASVNRAPGMAARHLEGKVTSIADRPSVYFDVMPR